MGLLHLLKNGQRLNGEETSQNPFTKSSPFTRLKYQAMMFREQAYSLGLARMATASIATRFRREFTVYQRDLRFPFADSELFYRLNWRRIEPDDAGLLLDINPAFDPVQIQPRLAKGEVGWIFFHGQKPVHYHWQAFGPTYLDYLGATMALGPKETLHQTAFTHRGYRRKGIFSYCYNLVMDQAREQGFRNSYGVVAWWNRASATAMAERCQMRPIGRVVRWGMGSISKFQTTGNLVMDRNCHLRVA